MSGKLRQRLHRCLSEETGAIVKDWGGRIPVALVYPNRYPVGMANLGFQTVYHHLNRMEQVVCERVFLPEPEDMQAAARAGLLSLESQRPLADFRLVCFSVSFENDFANLVHLLHLGKLSIYSDRRHQLEPLVVAGGVATFLNPEPIAPFVDLFLLGEAESLLHHFISVWEEGERANLSRSELLAHLGAAVPGAYVPSHYQVEYYPDGRLASFTPTGSLPRNVSAPTAAIAEETPATTRVFSPQAEFARTLLVEIGRGCGRGCRFCAAGFVYRPVRFRKAETLIRNVLESLRPEDKVGLVGAAVSDHPDIDAICVQLRQAGSNLTISSLRADRLVPGLLKALAASGLQTVAIAPEAGSQRLRDVINKNLSEKQILDAVTALVDAGILNVRLYFMIGLPTETDGDIAAIVDLVKRIKHRQLASGRRRGRLGTITLSVNSFVPKPFTPFQWVSFCDLALLKQRVRKIKRELGGIANVRVHADVPRWAYIQALLSRGDRRLAPLIADVVEKEGNWSGALKSINVNPDFYVSRERQKEELLPWDFIDHRVSKEYLWQEYQRALAARATPACDPGRCTRCGVCEETEDISQIS